MSKLSKMNTLINKLSDEKFRYGKNDCFSFTNALVKEWHGKDFKHLHKYKTEAQAELYMLQYGGIEKLTTGTLGYPLATPEFCKDGDVASAEVGEEQIALGFVYDGHALFKMKKKVARLPLKKCRMGWSLK